MLCEEKVCLCVCVCIVLVVMENVRSENGFENGAEEDCRKLLRKGVEEVQGKSTEEDTLENAFCEEMLAKRLEK